MAEGFIQISEQGLEELINDIRAVPLAIAASRRSVGAVITAAKRQVLEEALSTASIEAGDFPLAYQNHLRRSFNLIDIFITEISDDGIRIEVTDPEELGDLTDLEAGYHYLAIEDTGDPNAFSVSSPPRVDLPGPDQSLYAYVSKSGDRRAEYWQALSNGETSFHVDFHNWSGEMAIPAGAYERTLEARVREWGGRYPEWELLIHGSGGEGRPHIQPTNFQGIVEALLAQEVEQALFDIVDRIIEQLNNGTIRITGTGEQAFIRRTTGNTGQFAGYLSETA